MIKIVLFFMVSFPALSQDIPFADSVSGAQRLDSVGWVNLRNAIIAVESGGDSMAVNGRCVGVLQITPVYVKEANRVLGVEKYCLDDRLSVSKSVEMFEVVQGFWNKDREMVRAIYLHNPRGDMGYYLKIGREIGRKNFWHTDTSTSQYK